MPSTQTFHLYGNLQISVAQLSHAGDKPINEDAVGIRLPEGNLLTTKGAVAVIADGVSSAQAGREASETCVHNFLSDYYSTHEAWSVKKSAQQVLTSLNHWLYGQGQSFNDNRKGFISTFSCAVFKSHQAHIFHVGDSRVYRLRAGNLKQLTRDHTAAVSDHQTYLSRAMGLDMKLSVDYHVCKLQVDDIFLLSTDGIHDFIAEQEIKNLLQDSATLEQCCQNMYQQALANDSPDNLSCQILRIDQLPKQNIDDMLSVLTRMSFPPFLKPDMILDDYRILREIHASPRSQLYQVEDTQSGEQFCMKTPSVNFDDDPAYIERFIMESWIGSRISSPHVVKVLESGREKSCLYYLTEFIDGITLTQWMREHPKPPVEEVVNLIVQVAKGIRAFHRKETLHQDIKPDNITVDKDGIVRIVDFGACHIAGIAEINIPLQRDIVLGTANYIAPEYTVNNRINYRSDLFSLAVITYEMLTGELPFSGKLENCKTPTDFRATTYTPAYHLNPLVPIWIDGALRKSLRYLEEQRHHDISEFAYELQHPNPKYLKHSHQPLIARNPLLTWKLIAGLLAVSQTIMLVYFYG